jgi:hypothetical protein
MKMKEIRAQINAIKKRLRELLDQQDKFIRFDINVNAVTWAASPFWRAHKQSEGPF